MIKIVCENYRGEKMTFSRTPRMWIESISGLGADYEVTTSKNSGQDGDTLRIVAPDHEGAYWVRMVSKILVE